MKGGEGGAPVRWDVAGAGDGGADAPLGVGAGAPRGGRRGAGQNDQTTVSSASIAPAISGGSATLTPSSRTEASAPSPGR